MIEKTAILIPVAALAGFVAGFVTRRGNEPAAPPVVAGEKSAPVAGSGSRAGPAVPAVGKPSTLKSADSLDQLVSLDDHALYPRLALWLLDAPESEIAAFWASYRKRPERDTGVVDLIFSQWTRVNPTAAIAAAKGSGHEGIPWWAWAIHDPTAAVAAARGASKEMAGYVMRAIGQFHPDLARRVLEENPGFAARNALEGIVRGLARTDPEAALAFMAEHGWTHDGAAMENWVRLDPHAALEWLRDHPQRSVSSQQVATFVETLERENPDLLAELAASAPSGALKWKLDSAAFRHLVATDPEQALAVARASEAPRVVAERLAELGRKQVAEDPARALALFQELLARCPDATFPMTWTRVPGGGGGHSAPIAGVSEFITALVSHDPEAAIMMVMPRDDAKAGVMGADSFEVVSRTWVESDPDGFAAWVGEQEPGATRDRGVQKVATQLKSEGFFEDAVRWSGQISNADQRQAAVQDSFQAWLVRDQAAAHAWLEETNLPPELREALEPLRRLQQ